MENTSEIAVILLHRLVSRIKLCHITDKELFVWKRVKILGSELKRNIGQKPVQLTISNRFKIKRVLREQAA
jgi:hypothetical protein